MLFFKECKKTVCSMVFILYIFTVIFMYVTQFNGVLEKPIEPPEAGQEQYGMIEKEIPEILMPAAIESLVTEYLSGYYGAYPFMFYKKINLTENDEKRMAEIIEKLSGLKKEELDNFSEFEPGGYKTVLDDNGKQMLKYEKAVLPEVKIPNDMTYEYFKELMKQADEIIGGGSKYDEKNLVNNFSNVSMSYEEALEEYKQINENIAESYTRLFCDYIGIILAIIPVFVCAFVWNIDEKSYIEQLVYSKKISSIKIILIRYLALIFCITIPIIVIFIHSMIGVNNLYPDRSIHFLKAAGLAVLWLIPSILCVTSLGALLSESLSSLLAIFVQGVWWYISLEMNKLTGSITKWTLIIRHNTLGDMQLFERQFENFCFNRLIYTVLSLICICITIFIYDKKRKGEYYGKKFVFKNFKCKSKI